MKLSIPVISVLISSKYIWDFENFRLADEPFAKTLQIFQTCVSVINNLCGKLVSSLEFSIKFNERFKGTSVPFFIRDYNFKVVN